MGCGKFSKLYGFAARKSLSAILLGAGVPDVKPPIRNRFMAKKKLTGKVFNLQKQSNSHLQYA